MPYDYALSVNPHIRSRWSGRVNGFHVIRYLFILSLLFGLAGCAGTLPQPSQALPVDPLSPLLAPLESQFAANPGQSGFRLLAVNTDAFLARVALARSARHSLDIQYYIVHDGLTTRLLLAQVLEAAERGVRVRLLIDDTASDASEHHLATLATHPNIEIRLFNPLHLGRLPGGWRNVGRLFNLSQQHRRMHNKLWLADSAVAIVGGRNLGDEYFDAQPERYFSDLDVLTIGSVSEQLAQSFDQYWNHYLSKPVNSVRRWPEPRKADLDRLRHDLTSFLDDPQIQASPFVQMQTDTNLRPTLKLWSEQLIWANAQALWDSPSKVLSRNEPDPQLLMATQLMPYFQQAENELILVSAYFVPSQTGVDYLTRRADSGIDIRLLTNSLEATDVPAVHGGYAPYRRELLEHGIRIFELRPDPEHHNFPPPWNPAGGSSNASLHSKAVVFDRQQTFIGSFNLDPRSVLWNTEVGVVVDSCELAEQVRALAIQGMQPGISYEVRLAPSGKGSGLVWVDERDGRYFVQKYEPGSWWRRFNAWIARAVGLEKML